MPTEKGHAELVSDVASQIKARAFFSARVAEGHILDRLRDVSDRYSRGEMGLGEARNILKEFLRGEGMDPHQAGMRNLASTGRLNLILRQNAAMAKAAGEWKRMHDPDQLAVFPYVRYHSRNDGRTRGSHDALDGKIFDKNDPFLKTHTPPWEFNCRCWLEEITAKEAGDNVQPMTKPEDIRVESESGFVFDPEEGLGTFDLTSIKNEAVREDIIDRMEQDYGCQYREMKLFCFKKEKQEEPPKFDWKDLENAEKETKKLLPDAVEIRLWTTEAQKEVKPEHILHEVSVINTINRVIYEMREPDGSSCITSLYVEHLDPDKGARANPKKGVLELNVDVMNKTNWQKYTVKNGIYTDLSSLLYAGHEVESIVLHEIWHLKGKNLFGDGLAENARTPEMNRRLGILNDLFDRAIREENWISPHGRENPFEFFSEIKLKEKFDKASLPQYIIEALKEIGYGGTR